MAAPQKFRYNCPDHTQSRSNGAAEKMRPMSAFTCNYQDLVDVLVGPDETRFSIHLAYLCANSSFFKAACSEKWKERKDKAVRLPDCTPYSFAIYSTWVYTGNITANGIEFKLPISVLESQKDVYTEYISSYIIGAVLGDARLRNRSINKAMEYSTSSSLLPTVAQVNLAWKNLPRTCLIRWLLDVHAAMISEDTVYLHAELFPTSFIVELAKTLVRIRDSAKAVPPALSNACEYHEHTEDSEKCT